MPIYLPVKTRFIAAIARCNVRNTWSVCSISRGPLDFLENVADHVAAYGKIRFRASNSRLVLPLETTGTISSFTLNAVGRPWNCRLAKNFGEHFHRVENFRRKFIESGRYFELWKGRKNAIFSKLKFKIVKHETALFNLVVANNECARRNGNFSLLELNFSREIKRICKF